MRFLSFIKNFEKVLSLQTLLLLWISIWSSCRSSLFGVVQHVSSKAFATVSQKRGSGNATPIILVILLSVSCHNVFGATLRDEGNATSTPVVSEIIPSGISSNLTVNSSTGLGDGVTTTGSRLGRQLSIIAPALQTMGCLPKFFCGMNSRKPSDSTSTLNDLAYLIRFAMVDDEEDSAEKFKDGLNSEEYSNEMSSDERRREHLKYEHMAQQELILDDPEYLNFVWKDMKYKIKDKFKDGKIDDEVYQKLVKELEKEKKSGFKLPSIFSGLSGLKKYIRVGRSVPDSADSGAWENDRLRSHFGRKYRAFWDTEEFDEQMKLAARIGKTSTTDDQCTSTFNLCPYSVRDMKEMITGKPKGVTYKPQAPWYVNSHGPKEGDLTTARPRPKPSPTQRRPPRPPTPSPQPISHAIYVLKPESLDGHRPQSGNVPSFPPPPLPPKKKHYLGGREPEDDETGFDVPVLTYEKEVIEPTSSVRIIKLKNAKHDIEEYEDGDNNGGRLTSSEEEENDEDTKPKRQKVKPTSTVSITKHKVAIGLPRPKYTLQHKFRRPSLKFKGGKKTESKPENAEIEDSSEEQEYSDKSKDKSQESDEDSDVDVKQPIIRNKDKNADDSNESEDKQKNSNKNTPKDDLSSEEKNSSEENKSKPPIRIKNKNTRRRPVTQRRKPNINNEDSAGNDLRKDSEESKESAEKNDDSKPQEFSDPDPVNNFDTLTTTKDEKSSEEKQSSEEEDNKKQATNKKQNDAEDSDEYEYSQEPTGQNKRPASLRPINYSYFKGKPQPTNSMPTMEQQQRPSHGGNQNQNQQHHNGPPPPQQFSTEPTQKPSFFSSWFGGNTKKPQEDPNRPSGPPQQHPNNNGPQPPQQNGPYGNQRPPFENSQNDNEIPSRPVHLGHIHSENGPPINQNHHQRPQITHPPESMKQDADNDGDDSSSEEDSPPSKQSPPKTTQLPQVYDASNSHQNNKDNRPVITDPAEVRPAKPPPQSRFPKLPRFPPPPRRYQFKKYVPITASTSTTTTEKPTHKTRKDESASKEDEDESKEDDNKSESQEQEESKEEDPLRIKNIFSKSTVNSLGESTSYDNTDENGQPIPPPPPPIANWKPLNLDEKHKRFSNITKSQNALATLVTPTKFKAPYKPGSYEKPSDNSEEDKEDDSTENEQSKEQESPDDDENSDEDEKPNKQNNKPMKKFEDDEADNPENPRVPTGAQDIAELGEVVPAKFQVDPLDPVAYPPVAQVSPFQSGNEVKVPQSNNKRKTQNGKEGGGSANTKNTGNSGPGGGTPSVPNPGGGMGGNRRPGGGNGNSQQNPAEDNSSEENESEEVGKSEEVADKTSEEDEDDDRGRTSLIKKLKKSSKEKNDEKQTKDADKKDVEGSNKKRVPYTPLYTGMASLPPIYKWTVSPTTMRRLTKQKSVKPKASSLKPAKPTKDNFYSKPLSPKLVQYLRDTYGNAYVTPQNKRTTTTTTTPKSTRRNTKKTTKKPSSKKSKKQKGSLKIATLGSQSTEVIHFDEFENIDNNREDSRFGHRTGIPADDKKSKSTSLPPVYGKVKVKG